MKKWIIRQPDEKAVSLLTSKTDLQKLAAEVIVSRGIDTLDKVKDFFSDSELSSPFLINDMQEAVEIITNAVEDGKSICIYGDYDCDGITSTVMLYSYLECLGADVSYYIPEREEGYGLNCDAIRKIAENGVELIITVDNGISAIKEAELIKELGIELVITDHHQPSDTLPCADAIVDPHRKDCTSPFKNLCGAGVVLKLLAALDDGNYDAVIEQFGDLAAIGTVADIVSLTGENRTIVNNGLRLLANTENLGLSALMEEARLSPEKINSTAAAFMIAPRINAAGRFGSPTTAVKLFLSEDEEEAGELAKELSELNAKRKKTENEIMTDIEKMIAENPDVLNERVLVLSGENWHHGVIGIVSARILQKYGKPNFIISIEGENARGSARSIEGYSIFKALSFCKEKLERFGGHNGAGGFSLKTDDIKEFTEMLYLYSKTEHQDMPQYSIIAEKILEPSDLTIAAVSGLDVLEPFGESNPRPIFAITGAKIAEVISLSEGKHTKLKLFYKNTYIFIVIFGVPTSDFLYKAEDYCDFLVSLEKNIYNGNTSISIRAVDYRKSGIKQAKYFAAKQTYEKIKLNEGIASELKERIIPSRDEMITVFKAVQNRPVSFDTLYSDISSDSMNYCKYRFCLDILNELNIINIDYVNEIIIKNPEKIKADLESSEILRKLRCL